MWDVNLAEFAEIFTRGVDDRSGVVIHTRQVFLVHRHDDDHLVLLGQVHHQLGCRTVGHLFGQVVPLNLLLGAEVWSVEQLLQADNLDALFGCVVDHGDVLVDHRLFDFFHGDVAGSQSVA